jgi:DNA-directed RNA polymerase subunit RPC12/RpoP
MWVVLMHNSVNGAMNMSSIRVVHGKDGTPIMVRDEEPFFVEKWSDEMDNEYVNEYRLVFDFREGLQVEIVQRLIGGGEFSWEVTLDNLDAESLMRLKDSGSLERIRAKVKEIMQQLTENLDSLFFDPIGDRRRSCYVCHSNAPYECIRCSRDICDQHAVFAETEYEEPLIYCHECFDKVIEK